MSAAPTDEEVAARSASDAFWRSVQNECRRQGLAVMMRFEAPPLEPTEPRTFRVMSMRDPRAWDVRGLCQLEADVIQAAAEAAAFILEAHFGWHRGD